MTVHHPPTYDNAKSLEAHLLDAHGVQVSFRESLVELIELHDSLHSDNPPETAQGGVIHLRYPHVHGDDPEATTEPWQLTDIRKRMEKSAQILNDEAHAQMNARERKRLLAKAEGVMLCIDYTKAY